MPDSGNFTAQVDVAGQDIPLDLSGRIDFTIEAPELKETLAAGTILAANDIVMQSVPAKLVVNGNIASEDQLVGKQLQRQSHAGMLLKVSDVADPTLIQRNDPVTVYLHTGALTLTVKGMALNAASLGQPVAVLNAISKKVIHGVARSDGGVEIAAMPLSVAGL
jgi:flagella basal body P-ring formation protein FlgA